LRIVDVTVGGGAESWVSVMGRDAAMFVHERGLAGAPAVLFLHGAGASGLMWREHVDRLQDRFHCLAPDLPGFGQSRGVPFVSRAVTAELVAELVESRVPAGTVHVVALSWGGGVAHELLARRPGLVDRAVIDGAGVLTSRSGPAVLAGVSVVAPWLHTRPVSGLFARMIGMDEQGRDELRAASPVAFRRAFVEGFRSGVSRVEARSQSPTLLVCGEQETAVRPANAALAAVMPDAQARYVPGVGHGWLARRPELHVAMVQAWLTGAQLPEGLLADVPSPTVVARLRRELGDNAADRDASTAPRTGVSGSP
jgi:pimeloyl-ACP methyl ester carboxylesterase